MMEAHSLDDVPLDAGPELVSVTPGPASREWIARLAKVECPAITARRDSRRERLGSDDPIVWAAARGSHVVDADGNRFVDLAGGFGVAFIGHAHPKIRETISAQAARLIHGMGDLFPSREKILLGEALAAKAPGDLQQSLLGLNGSDAVEASIKTACIATGKSRVLAFRGGYHGMGIGALGVSGYRDSFRRPFRGQIRQELRLPYPHFEPNEFTDTPEAYGRACLHYIDQLLADECSGSDDIAAIIVEPIQARGGDIVPPRGWFKALRELCTKHNILLIADEIYSGCGRTGTFWASDREQVVPDLLLTGKALGGGLPISACIGSEELMGAWGASRGEAIHTSTFLGHPLACATALTTLEVIESEALVERAATLGERLKRGLEQRLSDNPCVAEIRGEGLLLGVALKNSDGEAWAGGGVSAMEALIRRGWLAAPSGPLGDVLSLSPAANLPEPLADQAIDVIGDCLDELSAHSVTEV